MRHLPAGSCPGGLVAVLLDANGDELQRAELKTGTVTAETVATVAAETHAEHVRDDGGSVCIFDGDSGRALVVLTAEAVIVLGPLP